MTNPHHDDDEIGGWREGRFVPSATPDPLVEETYSLIRFYQDGDREVIATGLSLDEAQQVCRDPESASSTCTDAEGTARTAEKGAWFVGYNTE